MIILEPSVRILSETPDMEKLIEFAIRHCYKSEDKTTDDSYKRMIEMVIKNGHMSTLEHGSISVEILTNRGVLAEITRHRLASFSVESTRYCNYSADHKGMKICRPVWLKKEIASEISEMDIILSDEVYIPVPTPSPIESILIKHGYSEKATRIATMWYDAILYAETAYNNLVKDGVPLQFARGVLPNDLAVSMVMTANVREWRTILGLRHDAAYAHPDIVNIMDMLLEELSMRHPTLFPKSDFPSGDFSSRLEFMK